MTAENEYFEQQFNGIIAANKEVQSSATQRVTEASVDAKLIVAVRDEIHAQIGALFLFDEAAEFYQKERDDAHNRLLDIAVNIQAEYGLTDEETLEVLKLARLDIQQDIRPID